MSTFFCPHSFSRMFFFFFFFFHRIKRTKIINDEKMLKTQNLLENFYIQSRFFIILLINKKKLFSLIHTFFLVCSKHAYTYKTSCNNLIPGMVMWKQSFLTWSTVIFKSTPLVKICNLVNHKTMIPLLEPCFPK